MRVTHIERVIVVVAISFITTIVYGSRDMKITKSLCKKGFTNKTFMISNKVVRDQIKQVCCLANMVEI